MATCVFCGEKPVSKTKEHVLSDWLIKLTGNEGNDGNFGFDLSTNPPKQRKFAFDKFTFPACESCNQSFKVFEDNASKVIKKMIRGDGLTELELNTLLDWLDKIRIGNFLAFNTLDKGTIHFITDYYIKNSIGLFDRMLIINRTSDDINMLSVRGCDTLAFRLKSNCFSMVINNLFLFSYVAHHLFSRRLGFPHLVKNGTEYKIEKGTERIMYPLIRKNFNSKGTEIYQPMFPWHSDIGLVPYYDCNYVKENSCDFDKGVGRIFINMNRKIGLYENQYDWIPNTTVDYFNLSKNMAKQVCITQIDALNNSMPPLDLLTPEKKKEILDLKRKAILNNKLIRKIIDANIF